MKVNVYETVEVSDQQRIMIAQVLDESLTPKRKATRAEMKTFVWDQGSEWASSLNHFWAERFGPGGASTAAAEDEPEEDLIGLLGDDSADEAEDDTDDELADLL